SRKSYFAELRGAIDLFSQSVDCGRAQTSIRPLWRREPKTILSTALNLEALLLSRSHLASLRRVGRSSLAQYSKLHKSVLQFRCQNTRSSSHPDFTKRVLSVTGVKWKRCVGSCRS